MLRLIQVLQQVKLYLFDPPLPLIVTVVVAHIKYSSRGHFCLYFLKYRRGFKDANQEIISNLLEGVRRK